MMNLAFEQVSGSDVCKLKSLQPGNIVLRKKSEQGLYNSDQEPKEMQNAYLCLILQN